MQRYGFPQSVYKNQLQVNSQRRTMRHCWRCE